MAMQNRGTIRSFDLHKSKNPTHSGERCPFEDHLYPGSKCRRKSISAGVGKDGGCRFVRCALRRQGLFGKKPDIRPKREEELKQLPAGAVFDSCKRCPLCQARWHTGLFYLYGAAGGKMSELWIVSCAQNRLLTGNRLFCLLPSVQRRTDRSHTGPSAREQTVFISVHCAENDP